MTRSNHSNRVGPDDHTPQWRRWLAEKGKHTGVELGVNLVLPCATFLLTASTLGDVRALLAASLPPAAWAAFELARSRRVDALSLLVLAGLALSLLGFVGGGGTRFLQLREQLVAAVIGCVFLVSVAAGRPLVLPLARARMRRRSAEALRSFESLGAHPAFERTMRVLTLAWGAGLVVESGVCCALVFVLPVAAYVFVSPLLGSVALVALTAWSFRYARHALRGARRTPRDPGGEPPMGGAPAQAVPEEEPVPLPPNANIAPAKEITPNSFSSWA